MIKILRGLGLILSVGVTCMLISMIVTDLISNPSSLSLSALKTKQTRFTYISYLGSYSHKIRVGASTPGVQLHIKVIPVEDYSRMISNRTWSPLLSKIIEDTGLFEFNIQRRGYYVILIELKGNFNHTDYGLSYSFTRSVQDDLIEDALPLIALGMILLAFSFIFQRRR